MDEMRSEIRAAFEKEQMAHAPTAALRHDVVDAVSAQPRRAPNLQWVAIAAALILGILVVVGLMSTRFHPRASVPANPNATPKASPVADYGPPPAGVPLLYVHDPSHPTWLIGYDWSGQPRGTVKFNVNNAASAPDGQLFVVGGSGKGGGGTFFDRLAQSIPGPAAVTGYSPMWADDNRHMCDVSLDQLTFEWKFSTQLPGEAVKQVAVIAREPNAGGQTGIRLASCSFRNDQAILVRTTVSWPSELWVVRISNGNVLFHNTYSNTAGLANMIASRDSAFIAENSSKSIGQLQGSTSPSTIIRRVSDRSVVATLDPSMAVLAFSGDDSLVLVSTSSWVGGQAIHLALIDVRSSQVLWRYDGPEGLGSYLAQPDGTGFAVALKVVALNPSPCGTTPQTACHSAPEDPLSDILIVHGDGTRTAIPGRHVTTW